MARPTIWPPKPAANKGRSRVWWRGRWHDLGPLDSAQARAEYGRLVALWAVDPDASVRPADDVPVAELCAAYLESGDCPAGKVAEAGRAIALLLRHHLATPVKEFGPVELKAWQAWLGADPDPTDAEDPRPVGKYARSYVAALADRVRRIWRWAVSAGRLPVEYLTALESVGPPPRGCGRVTREVTAAPREHVLAARDALRPPARALLDLMLLTGARPSELFKLRPADVLRGGVHDLPRAGRVDLDAHGVWVYVPDGHKAERFDKPRWVPLGPAARAVLLPFLDRPGDEFCFSPAEAKADRHREAREARLKAGGGAGGDRKVRPSAPRCRPGRKYSRDGFRQAVHRACEAAGVPTFNPYQVRHLVAAEADDAGGLDEAQALLGHSSAQTTRRYAKRAFGTAAKAALKRGAGPGPAAPPQPGPG